MNLTPLHCSAPRFLRSSLVPRCDARSLSPSVRSAVRSLAGDPDLGIAAVPGRGRRVVQLAAEDFE